MSASVDTGSPAKVASDRTLAYIKACDKTRSEWIGELYLDRIDLLAENMRLRDKAYCPVLAAQAVVKDTEEP
jgi:hypothetical protein